MPNPPTPLTQTDSPITYGTILQYGLGDLSVAGIIIDSYRRDGSYADTQEVTNQVGLTVGVRMQDFRANVSLDGRVLQDTPFTVKAGATLEVNGDTIVITQVSYSGQARGFHSLSISGTAYEGVTGLEAAGF
jgi:hypothetical protein